jgi:molecular chaperone DnaJ
VATSKRDYYEILSVTRTASGDEIKRSYRRLAMKYHPDRADGNKAESEAAFKECAEAYEVLSDPDKRRRYDQFGHQGVGGQHDFSHMDVGDIFSMFDDIFGGAFGGRAGAKGGARARPQRGFDLEMQVQLTLSEVGAGCEKSIEVEKQDACPTCKGSGAKPGSSPVVCVQCGGQGRVAQQGFGGMFRMVTNCPNCRGRGSVIRDHCTACGGSGRQMRKRVLTVKIPAGVHEGQAVRVVGEGEAGEAGTPPGDLHCYITLKPHPLFTRHGNDLVCQIPVPFTLAALGGRIEVPTLRASADLDVPAGTQHGEVFKLKGKGLPDLRSSKTGDELVQIVVEIPRKLTDKQKTLLRDFAALDDPTQAPQPKGIVGKLRQAIKGD